MKSAAAATIPLTDLAPTAADFRAELLAGLRARPRHLPCKFFYDEQGSLLFDQICHLPEYYPTRTECGILAANGAGLSALCGPDCLLVELGSGNGTKTRLLLDQIEPPAGYVPIDISRPHLQHAAAALAREYPALEILPVCADYAQPLRLPDPEHAARRTVLFFPGSTIGNFEPAEAAAFLERLGTWCRPGDRLLIGVDLDKDRSVLEAAYNDASGVTAAFNRNVLARANRELGANFRLGRFSHEAVYNAGEGRIEMHLVSTCEQRVTIDGTAFAFEPGEHIVTEYSYKYRPSAFAAMARAAGWEERERWTDPRGWFGLFGLELAGRPPEPRPRAAAGAGSAP